MPSLCRHKKEAHGLGRGTKHAMSPMMPRGMGRQGQFGMPRIANYQSLSGTGNAMWDNSEMDDDDDVNEPSYKW